jgi:hypothetical protein
MTGTLVVAPIAACGAAALLLAVVARQLLRRRRHFRGTLVAATALALVAAAALVFVAGTGLTAYQRLTHEETALEVQFTQVGERTFDAVLTYPAGNSEHVTLRGDEWQVDARILKWHALANVLGFDAAYRLERINGRYRDVADERTQPRTVYPLNPPHPVDVWALVQRYRSHLPWVDAYYGSGAYVPMADGALFEVDVSQSGLVARPVNIAARRAIGAWR